VCFFSYSTYSTLTIFFRQFGGFQALGEGALKTPVYEVKQLLVLNKRLIKKVNEQLCLHPIGSIFSELNATSPEDVSLEKVKPDRRELDKIIMGEILGLTEEEQLEVYCAVIDLVKSRLEKAKSVKKKKLKEGIDIDSLVKTIM